MNNEELLIVPNISGVPSFVDEDVPFFYNTANDYYYYYNNGNLYVNDSNNDYELNFVFNGKEIGSIISLREKIQSFPFVDDNSEGVSIEISYNLNNRFTILPKTSDASLNDVALLQFDGTPIAKIYPKVIFNKKGIPVYYHNAIELNKVFFNGVLVFEKDAYLDINNRYFGTVVYKDVNGETLSTENHTSGNALRQSIDTNSSGGKMIEVKEE